MRAFDRALSLFAIALLAWSLCLVVEHDTPWYLAAGDLVLRLRALPAHDPFSFTSTIPWLDHEWLSELLLALAYRVGAWPGLAALSALGVALPIVILACRPNAFAGAAPLLWLLSAFVLREAAAPRASLFSDVLFAATLALVLDDGEDDRLGGRLWWCLALQLVWTQLHGGNPLGVVLLGLRFVTGPTRRRLRVAAACALATVAGPYGWRVHAHFLSAHDALPMIREWQPLGPALAAGALAPWVFVLLSTAALVLCTARERDPRGRFALAAILLFGAAGLRWTRFSIEASLVAAAVAAPLLAERTRRLRSAWVLPAALLLGAVLGLGSSRRAGLTLDPSRFPIAAVDWLRAHRPPGPMFNSYNFGGYLLWARPEEPVFVDGRAFTVYDTDVLAALPALYAEPRRWDALVARYDLRLAVLQRSGRGAGLDDWLAHHPAWRLVHEDALAHVFVRVTP